MKFLTESGKETISYLDAVPCNGVLTFNILLLYFNTITYAVCQLPGKLSCQNIIINNGHRYQFTTLTYFDSVGFLMKKKKE